MNDSKSIRSILLAAAIAVLTAGIASTPALAVPPNTATAQINVSATVLSNCTISATPLAFGNYTGLVNNSTSTISVTCTNTTPYNVGLDAGTTTGSTTSARKMTNGAGATLPYGLYKDGSHSTNWGNTIGTDTATGTGIGSVQNLTVNGQIAANQFVTPGSYSDTITATVTY